MLLNIYLFCIARVILLETIKIDNENKTYFGEYEKKEELKDYFSHTHNREFCKNKYTYMKQENSEITINRFMYMLSQINTTTVEIDEILENALKINE